MAFPKIMITDNGFIVDNHPLAPPFFSILNQWPHLKGRSIVIGFIGPRGSGKGSSAARMMGLEYLLKGRKVWSNMPIGLDLVLSNGQVHPLRSIERGPNFDIGNCYNGCLFSDEMNESDADAYRSQSGESLDFANDIQELRKNKDGGLSKMDFIWTTQSETWIPPRLRFQTDIIIECADLSLTKKVGIGEYSRWQIWDYSGMITGSKTIVKMPVAPIIFTKPWWHTYQTGLKQRDRKKNLIEQAQNELYEVASKIATDVRDNDKIAREKIWRKYGITNHKEQVLISRILVGDFNVVVDGTRQYFKLDMDLVEA